MSTDVDVDEHGIVRDGGRVRVPVMLMDSADALMRREFPTSHGLADVALCRPGFRTSSTRLNARD